METVKMTLTDFLKMATDRIAKHQRPDDKLDKIAVQFQMWSVSKKPVFWVGFYMASGSYSGISDDPHIAIDTAIFRYENIDFELTAKL